MRAYVVGGALGLALAACQVSPPLSVSSPPVSASPTPSPELAKVLTIPSLTLETLEWGGGGEAPFSMANLPNMKTEQVVFQRPEDVTAFVALHPLTDPSKVDAWRRIDYGRDVGLLVLLAPQPSTSERVEIVAAEERPEEVLVHAVRWNPARGATIAPMISLPYHLVRMARPGKAIRFAPVVDGELGERPSTRVPLP